MKKFLTNATLSLDTRYCFVETYVYYMLLCGTELWTMGKRIMQWREAFEMWIFWGCLKIPRTWRMTNENVIRMMVTDTTSEAARVSCLRDIYTGTKYQLLKLSIDGQIERSRKKKCSWLKSAKKWRGLDTQSHTHTHPSEKNNE